MTSIGKYGKLNAQIRAMRSRLLTEAAFRKLISAGSVEEIISNLLQTRLKDITAKIEIADSRKIDYLLTFEEIRQWKHLKKNCPDELKRIILFFLEEYEIRQLKYLFRLWYKKKNIDTVLLHEKIIHEFPVQDIIKAKDIYGIIDLLSEMPYSSVLSNASSLFDKHGSLFQLETALDKDYYSRLWIFTDSLSRKDSQVSKKMLGIEIDLKNLEWLVRFKKYYGLEYSRIRQLLIPHGRSIEGYHFKNMNNGNSALNILGEMFGKNKIDFTEDSKDSSTLAILEEVLYSLLFSEARQAFSGFPFSVSILWGFRVMLQIEMKNLRSLIQCKTYKVNENEIENYLVL